MDIMCAHGKLTNKHNC